MVNTCAFIEAARQESIDTILELADARRAGARLVVTGCMAERYGDELTEALPEVDLVAPFGIPLTQARTDRRAADRRGRRASTPVELGRRTAADGTVDGAGTVPPSFDLFNLPRPASRGRGRT